MDKIQMYSKKLGKVVDIKTTSCKRVSAFALGWMNSGWSKSGGWKVPPVTK